jgi:hypothetical protein
VPPAGAAAGYYGGEAKDHVGHGLPPQGAYDPKYASNRVSHMSETGTPVPPYHNSGSWQQQAPMELDGTSARPVSNVPSQPVYEVPGHIPGSQSAHQ